MHTLKRPIKDHYTFCIQQGVLSDSDDYDTK